MMKNKLFALRLSGLMLLLGLCFTSCISEDDIIVNHFGGISLEGISDGGVEANFAADITNLSRKNLTLTKFHAVIERGNQQIVEIDLREKVILPKRSSGMISLPLSIKFGGLGGLLSAALMFKSGGQGCTLSIYATTKAGWISKRIKVEDIPLDKFLQEQGVNTNELFNAL